MKGTNIGEFEELVLLTIALLYEEAYGVAILKEIEARTGRTISIGSLHCALDRVEEKGLVKSWYGEPTAERGGKRKRYFELTAFGKRSLRDARELREGYWKSIPRVALKPG